MFSLDGIDHGLLYGLNQGRQPWLSNLMIVLGNLSGNVAITTTILAISFYCIFTPRMRVRVILYPVAVLSGFLAIEGVKRLVERERPNVVPWVVPEQMVHGFSFPSGHATNNTLLALLVLSFLLRMELRFPVKIFLVLLTIIWVLAIGFNRVYLGVHWPTDVLGGWCLGGFIGMTWLKVISFLEQPKKQPTESQLPS